MSVLTFEFFACALGNESSRPSVESSGGGTSTGVVIAMTWFQGERGCHLPAEEKPIAWTGSGHVHIGDTTSSPRARCLVLS